MSNDSNMPPFIKKAPWYLNQSGDGLKHQGRQTYDSRLPITIHTEKGITSGIGVYKYRKGACDNCGSMTHTIKECCERPRKRGAKFSGKDFKPDEFIYEVPLDYEGKRDRWNGYVSL
jgi:pre-mRNA-processing factor SLU7